MSIDTTVEVVGVVVAIIFGILGSGYVVKRYVTKSKTMNQVTKGNSISIQSGRDTKIDG